MNKGETMKKLWFSNAVFHDGLNLTVRRGIKWNLVDNDEQFFISLLL